MAQLYEIRETGTGKVLLKDATPGKVSKFWRENTVRESRTQKISGVIVIFVKLDEVAT